MNMIKDLFHPVKQRSHIVHIQWDEYARIGTRQMFLCYYVSIVNFPSLESSEARHTCSEFKIDTNEI